MPEEKDLSSTLKEWHDSVYAPFRDKGGERRKKFSTTSGVEISPIYTPADDAGRPYSDRLGFPGSFPFTRGVYPTMYRGKLWTMRQYAGFGTAEETNVRFRYLLERGQTGLSVAFDLPTQMGYDSDNRMAQGEVGRVGVAIDTMDDFRELLKGIPLDKVSTSMTINATAAILLAMYVTLAGESGIDSSKLSGTIQNDILKEYYARGTYIYPPAPSMRIITDIFAWCRKNAPKWNTISISGYHIREAGSTAVQEIAFTLADAVEYIEAAVSAGLAVDEFAPRLSFFFCVHNNIIEEVAKFRAARRIYARIMKERFGSRDDRSCLLRFHSQTAGCSLTAQQPENNVIRVAMQALASVLGGTQSLHTNSKDEAISLPAEESVLTALRTQQIIAEESGICDTADPLGGSFYVESMTDRIEEKVLELMSRIEEMGGMTKAIEKQFPQREIERSAYEYQKGIEGGDITVVGVNKHTGGHSIKAGAFRVDPEIEKLHVERLRRFREKRDNRRAGKLLDSIEEAARGTDNLVPVIMEAVSGGCTLGEISAGLEKVFGRYAPGATV